MQAKKVANPKAAAARLVNSRIGDGVDIDCRKIKARIKRIDEQLISMRKERAAHVKNLKILERAKTIVQPKEIVFEVVNEERGITSV